MCDSHKMHSRSAGDENDPVEGSRRDDMDRSQVGHNVTLPGLAGSRIPR